MTEKDSDQKKDLTSLVELSALEMAKAPPGSAEGSLDAVPQVPITEAEFGNLEEISHEALSHAAESPALENPEAIPMPEALPALDAGPLPASEIPPVDFNSDGSKAESILLPSDSKIQVGDQPPEINALDLPPLTEESVPGPELGAPFEEVPTEEPKAEAIKTGMAEKPHYNEAPPDPKKRQMFQAPAPSEPTTEPATELATEPSAAVPASDSYNEPALVAPPAALSKTKVSSTPPAGKQDLEGVKKFGDKLSIGKPKVDAVPAFSVLIKSKPGGFTEKEAAEIKDILDADDYGVRYEDVAMQVSAGKLLLPQVSEFAAITFAQKVREFVDSIELDLAGEIFKSSAFELTKGEEQFWMDREHFYQSQEEVRDLSTEPKSERDLFSSNLSELNGYQVTRILSAVTASEILPAEVAEKRASGKFEAATDKLTRELLSRAFKLGAHGVIGIAFTLKPIEVYKDESGQVGRAYRLLGSGTAVRARRK